MLVAGNAIFGTADPEKAATRAESRRNGCPSHEALTGTVSDPDVGCHACPRPLRGDRQNGRRLSRKLFSSGFEVARTDLLRAAGWTYKEMEADGFSLPVIEAHCEYKQPARLRR